MRINLPVDSQTYLSAELLKHLFMVPQACMPCVPVFSCPWHGIRTVTDPGLRPVYVGSCPPSVGGVQAGEGKCATHTRWQSEKTGEKRETAAESRGPAMRIVAPPTP